MKDSNFNFYKLVPLSLILIILPILINPAYATEIQGPDTKKTDVPIPVSFLIYNDTVYGISVDYPPDWQFIIPPAEAVLSLLEDMSSSESQGILNQNDEITSKVLDVLKTFGLQKVSDILGLKPNERQELIQIISEALNNQEFKSLLDLHHLLTRSKTFLPKT